MADRLPGGGVSARRFGPDDDEAGSADTIRPARSVRRNMTAAPVFPPFFL
ncbi:hypothetical protein [Burkholderia territorii]|nr:hypothetical protein [Burkholderia territorii]